jgi:hypothetical protein
MGGYARVIQTTGSLKATVFPSPNSDQGDYRNAPACTVIGISLDLSQKLSTTQAFICMFCANCGKQLETSVAYCPSCGAKSNKPPSPQGSAITGANALRLIRGGYFIVPVSMGVLILSFSQAPQSVAYQVTAVLGGAAIFFIVWQAWRKKIKALPALLLIVLLGNDRIAEKVLGLPSPSSWGWGSWLSWQFFLIQVVVFYCFAFVFRKRILASLSEAAPPA